MMKNWSMKITSRARGLLAAGVIVFSGWGAVVLTVQCFCDGLRLVRSAVSSSSIAQPVAPMAPQNGAERKAEPPATAQAILMFDARRALEHARILSQEIGTRYGGTGGEKHAAKYIASVFGQYGYEVHWQTPVPIPETGRSTQNVCATKHAALPLDDARTILIGGHYDSINRGGGSPGANDNASGIGVMLEIARVLQDVPLPYRIEFVAYGAEERQGTSFEHHHYGSRHHAASYFAVPSDSQVIGMLCVDMVGVGETLYVRNMNHCDDMLVRKSQWSAERLGFDLPFKSDRSGCSDHEPYEKRGIPVAWFERLPDPDNHSNGDRYENIDPIYMRTMGRLGLHLLLEFTEDELAYLADVSPSS